MANIRIFSERAKINSKVKNRLHIFVAVYYSWIKTKKIFSKQTLAGVGKILPLELFYTNLLRKGCLKFMLTLKLPHEKVSDPSLLSSYVWQGTGLYHKLYNNFELQKDENFVGELLYEFTLYDKSMYGFSVDEIKGNKKGNDARTEEDKVKIARIEYLLKHTEFKTKKEKSRKIALEMQAARLRGNLNKDSSFGGKALQRKITTAAQNIQARFPSNDEMLEFQKKNPGYTYKDYEEYVLQQIDIYWELKQEYKESRKHGVYLIGRACESGNRKVDFDMRENWVVFKPNKETQITITYKAKKKQAETLWKLQKMADAEIMPITVRIDDDFVYFMYDEEMLAGYNFDDTGKNRYIEENNITSDEGKKKVWEMFCKNQRVNQLIGKKENRFGAVDLNPYEIGFVIGDKLSNDPKGDFKVIYSCCYNLQKLHKKYGLASDDPKQIRQNNKLDHEIKEVWKDIFKTMEYFHVAHFGSEELKFKINKSDYGAEFNRLTKNLWHRKLTTNLITKYCNILGIKHEEVNPVYSSFIGNIMYDDYDCIASATEILRRRITKYIKGSSLFPELSSIRPASIRKVFYLLGEDVDLKGSNWRQLYKRIPTGGRFRNKDLKTYIDKFMASPHSGVRVLTRPQQIVNICS